MAIFNADTYPPPSGAPLAGSGRNGLKQRYLRARLVLGAAAIATDTVNLGILKTGLLFVPVLSFQLITAATGATGLAAGGVIKASWVNRDKSAGTATLYTVPSTAPATGALWAGPVVDPTAGADVPIGSELTITYAGALPATTDVEVALAYIEHADQ